MRRRLRRRLVLGCALLAGFACRAAPSPGPADFAYGQQIRTAGEAAAYRLTLPLGVYREAVYADLRDLRVFNGRGEVVPYALATRPADAATAMQSLSRPLFAITDTSATGVEALRLAIEAGGTSASAQARITTPVTAAPGRYLLDLRGLPGPVGAIRLGWPPATADFAGRISIDAGDSLDELRPLIASAVLANLHAAGESLVEDRVEFSATGAKFLRVSWIGKTPPVTLATAAVEIAAGAAPAQRLTLTVDGKAGDGLPAAVDYDLGAHLPVDRVGVTLPATNSILQADYFARDDAGAEWRKIGSGGVYRLADGGAELASGPLPVPTTTARYWRVQSHGPAAPLPASPRLVVQWLPADLIFVASGPGPYLLAYGSASAPGAEASLTAMPASIVPAAATLADVEVLGGPERKAGSPPAWYGRRPLLWAVLGMAVLVLGAMAYRLLRELGTGGSR